MWRPSLHARRSLMPALWPDRPHLDALGAMYATASVGLPLKGITAFCRRAASQPQRNHPNLLTLIHSALVFARGLGARASGPGGLLQKTGVEGGGVKTRGADQAPDLAIPCQDHAWLCCYAGNFDR